MRLGVVSDLHWRAAAPSTAAAWHGPGEFEHVLVRLRQALHCFAAFDVDAVLVAGDLADCGDPESIGQVLEACQEASAQVLLVAGNHDVAGRYDLAGKHDLAGDPLRLERACAALAPRGVASTTRAGSVIGGVRVAGVHVCASDGGAQPRLRELPPTDVWGREPVVLLSHYPALSLSSSLAAHGFRYPGDLLDRQQFADLLIDRSTPTIVLAGHLHARAAATCGAVLQLSSGALVEPPYECALIDIDASAAAGLSVRRECIRLAPGAATREPVFSPSRQEWVFAGSAWQAAVLDARENGPAFAATGTRAS